MSPEKTETVRKERRDEMGRIRNIGTVKHNQRERD